MGRVLPNGHLLQRRPDDDVDDEKGDSVDSPLWLLLWECNAAVIIRVSFGVVEGLGSRSRIVAIEPDDALIERLEM